MRQGEEKETPCARKRKRNGRRTGEGERQKKKDNIVKTLNKNARRVAKAEGEDGWMGRWRKMVGGV